MSSLYHKYRPKTFKTFFGNDEEVASIEAMLKQGVKKMNHAFMFTGPSGTGKTTLARLIALKLNITKDNIKEINSADFRGVDMARDIMKQMRLLPIGGGFKIYIIDECHKMTNDAQNAILKALEDTPDHVFFALATTEPNKLIKAIHTRCTRFDLELLDDDVMSSLVKRVIKKEGADIPKKAVNAVVENSLGSPRQALVLLEKIIHLDESKMIKAIEKFASEESEAILLARALMDKKPNWKKIAKLIKEIKTEPESLRYLVLKYGESVLLNGNTRGYLLLEAFSEPFYNTGRPGLTCACFEAIAAD
jgi:DNA polymerase III gamma/tau subunit